MKCLIKIGNEYCWKIYRGNYFVSGEKDKDLCLISKDMAKRYSQRLTEMGVKHTLILRP